MRKLSLLLAILAVVLTGATMVSAAPASAAPTASADVGISPGAPLMGESDTDLARDLDAIRASGAGWIRVGSDWSIIEGTRGAFNWASTDRVVDAARARGLQVLGLVLFTPRWAQDPSVPAGNTHGRPASATAFGTFAGQAAAHFAGRISNWEIWNEPNLSSFFAPRVDAPFYTSMLSASYSAIHAALPGATVMSGGLAPAGDTTDGSATSPLTFLTQMYAGGAHTSMDAVAMHPYCYPAMADDASTASWNAFYRLRNMHDVMASNGDGAKKIWLTEFGAPTATVQTGIGPVVINEQTQASMISNGVASARTLPYVGPTFVYTIRDYGTGNADPEQNYGMLRTDFSAKPAYAALQSAAATASSTPPPVVVAPPAPPPAPLTIQQIVEQFWQWLLQFFLPLFH